MAKFVKISGNRYINPDAIAYISDGSWKAAILTYNPDWLIDNIGPEPLDRDAHYCYNAHLQLVANGNTLKHSVQPLSDEDVEKLTATRSSNK